MTNYSLEDLRILLTAEHTGSLGRAAIELGLAQPSVSARVRQLERCVGTALFIRSRRGVRLTAAGERFVAIARRMLDLAAQAQVAISDANQDTVFTLGIHGTFAPTFVPKALAVLDDKVTLHVRDAHSEELVQLVDRKEVDLAIVVPVPTPASVRLQPLLDDEIVCVVHPDHPAAALSPPVTLSAIADSPLTIHAWGDTTHAFLQLVTESGIPTGSTRWVATASTVITLARDLDHVGIVPRSAVEGEIRRRELAVLDLAGFPTWTTPLLLAFRHDRQDHPETSRLCHELSSALA